MRSLVKPFTAAVFFLVFLSVAQVQADPLVVTSGSLTKISGLSNDPFRLNAFTFSFQGQNFSIQNQGLDIDAANREPGSVVSLSHVFSDFTAGSVLIDGNSYPGVNHFEGLFTFTSGSFVLPVDGTPTLTVTDTFTFNGFFFGYDPNVQGPVFSTQLTGTGLVTMSLFLGQDGLYYINGLKYEFGQTGAPVPEPATLLLLGSGLAGLAVRARRRKAQGLARAEPPDA